MCAFDLLTTVAGKLLLEGESTPNSTNTVKEDEDTSLKENLYNEGIRERGFFISPIVSEAPVVNHCLSKSKDTLSGQASVITSSDCSEKLDSAERFINCESKNETRNCSTKVEQEASGFRHFSNCTLGAESKKQMKIDLSNDAKIFGSDFPDLWDRKPTNLVASDNTVKLSLSTAPDPFGSFPVIRNDVKLDNRDDDENFGCTQPSTPNKASGSAPRVRDRPIKKLLASKYWEENLKSDNEGHANTGKCLLFLQPFIFTCSGV